jgi:hypothetical protein
MIEQEDSFFCGKHDVGGHDLHAYCAKHTILVFNDQCVCVLKPYRLFSSLVPSFRPSSRSLFLSLSLRPPSLPPSLPAMYGILCDLWAQVGIILGSYQGRLFFAGPRCCYETLRRVANTLNS